MNQKIFVAALGSLSAFIPSFAGSAPEKKPNIIFILADDMGYADLGCFGARVQKTPNLDRLAREGIRFTSFYAPAGVSTPTRASLLTGCYPKRVGLHVAVLPPDTRSGLNPDETTLAELMKSVGYTTGCIGKWHLGLLPEVSPNAHGFDYYYGMPGPNHGRSDLYRNNELLKRNSEVSYDQITKDYTREAVSFIQKNQRNPFFLYVAHSAVHIPLFASEEFQHHAGENGLYYNMIEELDWSCGVIFEELKRAGLERNTIIVFTSDNGPSGVAAPPLHGGKGSTWEAGFRVPLIVKWPGTIPGGKVSDEMATMMDFLPTFGSICGYRLPGKKIDGHDILPLLTRKNAKSQYQYLGYYGRDGKLAAIRKGQWKLHLLEPSEKWAGKQPVREALLDTRPDTPLPWLYDLSSDIGETKNISEANPEVVKELTEIALKLDQELEKELRPPYREKTELK
jgi:arylsulfatase A